MARILIADDQRTVLTLIESLLKSRGHDVTAVLNAQDAVDQLTRMHFDLLITDVMMPGASGFDLTRTVRKHERLQHLPVVILTGKREKKDIEAGIASGADDYVIKPIDPDVLLTKVDSLLNRKAKAATSFVKCTLKEEARWDVKTDIVEVSEIGLTLMSSLPAAVGSKVKIQSRFFQDVGIDAPTLRVVECEPADAEATAYVVQVHFVGLTEKAMTPLRMWIRSRLARAS